MLFDSTLLFFHTGNVYNFTAGEYVSLVGATASSASITPINLGNARDLGIGPGAELPMIAVYVGTAITSSSAGMLINAQFQGSTNSVLWTTYAETGPMSTASFAAGSAILPIAVPRRPSGVSLPLYYQMNLAITGTSGTPTISTGSVIGGIVLAQNASAGTLDKYSAGYTVA